MKVLQKLTNNLSELKGNSQFKKAEKGKWYHFQRVYAIKSSDGKYGLVSLNFFERLLQNICKVNYFKKVFEGKSITVIKPKDLKGLDQRINDSSRAALNPSNTTSPVVKINKDITSTNIASEQKINEQSNVQDLKPKVLNANQDIMYRYVDQLCKNAPDEVAFSLLNLIPRLDLQSTVRHINGVVLETNDEIKNVKKDLSSVLDSLVSNHSIKSWSVAKDVYKINVK